MSNIIDALTTPPLPKTSFDENESTDLAFHVRQCTKRYDAVDRKLVIITRLVWVIVLFEVTRLLHI